MLSSKHSLLIDCYLQRCEGLFHQFLTEIFFLVDAQVGVTKGMGDGNGWNNPVGPYGFGNSGDGTTVSHGDALSFNLFGYRCSATSTGASR